jgi:hypothetical protein
MVAGQLAAVVEEEEPPVPQFLHDDDEDVVSVETDVREHVAELGKKLAIESREIIIFIHRKFIVVAYKW